MYSEDMTEIETTINEAIEGGWKEDELSSCTNAFMHENANNGDKDCYVIDNSYTSHVTGERHNIAKHYSIGDVVTDPKFWQAVGKVRGWGHQLVYPLNVSLGSHKILQKGYGDVWQFEMCSFMFHLADGLTIEEALTKLR